MENQINNQFKQYIQSKKTEMENDLLALVAYESVEAEQTAKSPFGDQVGEALETVKDTLDSRNFYAVNPSFDR